MFVLGIDGGGTRTRAELRGGGNTFIRRMEFGPLNIGAIGADGFRAVLNDIFTACGDMSGCAALCIGTAGITAADAGGILRAELTDRGFKGALSIKGDHEIALAALESPGCVIIAGTGSICCGVNGEGTFARCGGLGHIIGDGGSGYSIGRSALAHAARSLDMDTGRDPLTRAVLDITGARDLPELEQYVYSRPGDKSHIAAAAPALLYCAASGDGVSLEILRQNAGELRLQLGVVRRRLGLERPRTALLGGLLEHEGIYRSIVSELLSPEADITVPGHDALWAAAELAFRSCSDLAGR